MHEGDCIVAAIGASGSSKTIATVTQALLNSGLWPDVVAQARQIISVDLCNSDQPLTYYGKKIHAWIASWMHQVTDFSM